MGGMRGLAGIFGVVVLGGCVGDEGLSGTTPILERAAEIEYTCTTPLAPAQYDFTWGYGTSVAGAARG